jgi:hypothetical protein
MMDRWAMKYVMKPAQYQISDKTNMVTYMMPPAPVGAGYAIATTSTTTWSPGSSGDIVAPGDEDAQQVVLLPRRHLRPQPINWQKPMVE